jgi:hypothetical protein
MMGRVSAESIGTIFITQTFWSLRAAAKLPCNNVNVSYENSNKGVSTCIIQWQQCSIKHGVVGFNIEIPLYK